MLSCATGEDNVVGHCHAVFTITRSPSHRERLLTALREVVDANFDWLPAPAPVDHGPHLKAILEHTILRRMDQTTGSLVKEELPEAPGPPDLDSGDEAWNRRRSGAAMVMKFCQSDPRGQKIVHHCPGCCESREAALSNVVGAIQDGGLITGFASTTPSKGRHGSTTEALGEQSAGTMIYDILPRTFTKAFPNWRAMEDAANENNADGNPNDEDKRKYMRGKTYRSVKYLANERQKKRASMLSWAAEPCDYLWMRLQYLDSRHSTLFDLQVLKGTKVTLGTDVASSRRHTRIRSSHALVLVVVVSVELLVKFNWMVLGLVGGYGSCAAVVLF